MNNNNSFRLSICAEIRPSSKKNRQGQAPADPTLSWAPWEKEELRKKTDVFTLIFRCVGWDQLSASLNQTVEVTSTPSATV